MDLSLAVGPLLIQPSISNQYKARAKPLSASGRALRVGVGMLIINAE
jgi:hypothetical protein